MNFKLSVPFILIATACLSCDRKPASIAGNIYLNADGRFLYIVDPKYAKNNYAIKRNKIQTIHYELKDGKFIYDDMMGKTILDITDDHSRIHGTCGVLQLDLKKVAMKDVSPEAKALLGL